MAVMKRAVPWWSLLLNFLLGACVSTLPVGLLTVVTVTFGNLVGSLFTAAILVHCEIALRA
ncbi:unnamed protein product, partial [Mycena citricolor]